MSQRRFSFGLIGLVLAAAALGGLGANLIGQSRAAFWQWSTTAGTNATADPTINWAEGMSPSSVNDSARAMMARLAEYRNDVAGATATGGTSTAYTLTTGQSFSSLANMANAKVCFVPHTTNGATVTLNVDGLTAKPLRSAPSVEIGAGVLVQGTPYCATYNNSTTQFLLHGFFGNPFNVPLGSMLDYTGSSAPNSNFVLPFGQAISRTTYAAYFTLVSTTYGVGDGVTTFNVPDFRGRLAAPLDNMGGSAASRITVAGSSCAGTTLGAACGGQNIVIGTGNVPALPLTIVVSDLRTWLGQTVSTGAGASASAVSANTDAGANFSQSILASGSITAAGTANLGSANTALNKLPPILMVTKILRVF